MIFCGFIIITIALAIVFAIGDIPFVIAHFLIRTEEVGVGKSLVCFFDRVVVSLLAMVMKKKPPKDESASKSQTHNDSIHMSDIDSREARKNSKRVSTAVEELSVSVEAKD